MTPEQLEQLIAQGDPMKLARAVESLDEPQRRKLSKTASQLLREIRRREGDFRGQLAPNAIIERISQWLKKAPTAWWTERTGEIAVLAVCPFSQARKIDIHFAPEHEPGFLKVLRDRRPDWIDKWVDLKLQDEFVGIRWEVLQTLINDGVCRKPTSDGYIRLMAYGLPSLGWRRKEGIPLSQRLLEQPDLLDEDVWRLFEVETYAFMGDANADSRAPEGFETWTTALVKLAAQGHLDRQRLLDASLSGLATGFKKDVLSGYARLHERLEPTADELAARQQTLIDLLSNQASHVVTFALKMLKKVEKGKKLDGEAFLCAVGPVFQMRTKGQPKSALSLTGQVVKRRPELVPWALNAAIEALVHESPDVQEQAVGLIEAWSPRAHLDHLAAIRERFDDLAPTARARVEPLLAKLGGAEPTPAEGVDEADDLAAELAALRERAERLDPRRRQLAGVDAVLEALANSTLPGPLEFDLIDVPVLTGLDPIKPIRSVDELIDAVAHGIETLDSADELERILDGISRLADQRPDDFRRRTAPLVKRMEDGQATMATRGLVGPFAPFSLRKLLQVWLRGTMPPTPRQAIPPTGLQRFLDARMNELIERARQRRPAPMLAAPTHSHGWIDPLLLVTRITEGLQQAVEIQRFDLMLALLRLAPDRRAEALDAAAALEGEVGRAVRWALGHDQGPTAEDRHASLWLAAGRARQPRGTLDALRAVGLGDDTPDAVAPACYRWRPNDQYADRVRQHGFYRARPLEVSVEPSVGMRDRVPLQPTVALHELAGRSTYLEAGAIWFIQWIGSIWPLNGDPCFARGLHCLMDRCEMPASSFEPNHAYLEPLFEPDRPWTEMARLAAWIGLLSTDADSRGTAVDALVEAVGDGRAHPAPMADVLVGIAAGDWLKLNRVADMLRETARLSPLHCWFAADVLQPLVASYQKLPRDAHHVLALLLELLTDLGLRLSRAAKDRLASIKGSSKTAKLARSLVALPSGAHSPKLQLAQLQLLEARLTRAERWSATTPPNS